MPRSVLDALRGRDVTLVVSGNFAGGPIVIYGGDVLPREKGRVFYPLSDLAELYAETGGESLPEASAQGRVNPVTGGTVHVVDAPARGAGHASAEPETAAPDAAVKAAVPQARPATDAAAPAAAPAAPALALLLAACAAAAVAGLAWKRKQP